MGEINAQAQVEPDPAATSIGNDETLNAAPTQDATTELSAAPTTSDDAAKAEQMTEQQHEGADEDKIAEMARQGEPETKASEPAGDEKEAKTSNGENGDSRDQRRRHDRDNGRDHARGKRNHDSDDRDHYKKQKRANNVKSSYDHLPQSSDADEIKRQVEFYFSDSNLPTDRFLLDKTGGHKNNPVPLKAIHSFKRMKRYQPYSAVVDAVKASDILDLTDDGEITRKVPLSDKYTNDIEKNRGIYADETMNRSIYAKGFGSENASTQKELEDMFAVYGTFNAVRLRRKTDGTFKGSVFVEFADEQTAKDFLALDPKPEYQGEELQIMSKKAYCDGKIEDIREGRIQPSAERQDHRNREHKSGSGDNWKERRDNDQRGGRQSYDRRGGRDGRDGGRGRGGNFRGGSRGRGGRGGGRRDRSRSHDRERRRSASPANGGADNVKMDTREDNKKRARDDEPAEQQAEKKAKVDEPVAA